MFDFDWTVFDDRHYKYQVKVSYRDAYCADDPEVLLVGRPYDANVTVPDSQTPERIATIVATVENVLSIVTEIIPKLDDRTLQSREGDSNRPIELRVLVHSS
ncbi:unnamed protein product, partial [Wuchereria bancrofti]